MPSGLLKSGDSLDDTTRVRRGWTTKDFPKVRRAARRQVWIVEATSDGEMFYSPDGRSKALWHHTPSDRNALKAFRAPAEEGRLHLAGAQGQEGVTA